VAYWDTEGGQAPPRLLGEIKGTPTIRLFKPKKKQKPAGSNKEKVVVDYQFERKAVDMKRFVDSHIPDFTEKIKNGLAELQTFEEKAQKYELPRVLLFVSKNQTMPLTKYLSTEFRRKLLVAEIKPTSKNQEIMQKYGVTEFPALIVFPVKSSNTTGSTSEEEESEPSEEMVRYDGDGFSRNKLHGFLSKYALKKIAVPVATTTTTSDKKKQDENEKKKDDSLPPQKEAVKEEL
jgi:hypothetical protein